MSSQQNYLVTVSVDGRSLGVFDTLSGGEVTAEAVKRRGGGMGIEKTFPALRTFGDVTVSRVQERQRDWELSRFLSTRVGRGKFVAVKQPLDDMGVPWGKPKTYVGRLIGITDPEVDSESTDVAMYELAATIENVA